MIPQQAPTMSGLNATTGLGAVTDRAKGSSCQPKRLPMLRPPTVSVSQEPSGHS
jgi:hypothetical protein